MLGDHWLHGKNGFWPGLSPFACSSATPPASASHVVDAFAEQHRPDADDPGRPRPADPAAMRWARSVGFLTRPDSGENWREAADHRDAIPRPRARPASPSRASWATTRPARSSGARPAGSVAVRRAEASTAVERGEADAEQAPVAASAMLLDEAQALLGHRLTEAERRLWLRTGARWHPPARPARCAAFRAAAQALAEMGDGAGRAVGLARLADIAAMQDQPVMGVALEFRRYFLFQRQFNRQRRFARREAGPVGDPEDMGVDRDGRLAEGDVEHHIGGLAPDAGQFLQRLARRRHLCRYARPACCDSAMTFLALV